MLISSESTRSAVDVCRLWKVGDCRAINKGSILKGNTVQKEGANSELELSSHNIVKSSLVDTLRKPQDFQ